MKVVIFADGGSRGNPGVAGSGTVVYSADKQRILREIAYVVGTKATNNVAEYHGLLRGLEAAHELGATEVEFYMDSKLVVEQVNGRWKIKHPDMQKLALRARALVNELDSFSLEWVPRAKNKVADALSNDAMDAAAAGKPVGIVGGASPAQAEPAPEPEADDPVAKADAIARVQAKADKWTAQKAEKDEAERRERAAARVELAGLGTGAQTPATDSASKPQPSDWLADRGPVTSFILLRHGQTRMSAAKQYSGRTDAELTELGQKQVVAAAQALAARFGTDEQCQIDAIVSSPLKRCLDTAAAVSQATGVEVDVHEKLTELDFGLWEGKTFQEARERDPELHSQWMGDASVSTPGGESLQGLHRRVRAARVELQKKYAGKRVLIVSHVNPIKSFLRQGLDAGPVTFSRIFLDLAAISEVEFWDGGSLVRGVNDVGHLAGLG